MDNIVSHNKNVISILVILVLLASLASAVTPTDAEVTAETYDINFIESEYLAFSSKYSDGIEYNISFMKSNNAILTGDYNYIKVMPGNGVDTGSDSIIIDSMIYELSNTATWTTHGFALYKLKPYFGNKTAYIYSDVDTRAIEPDGQDMWITVYVKPGLSVLPPDYDGYPSIDVAKIVGRDKDEGMRSVVSFTFDVLEIMIIITVIVGLVILLIILWKVFEWFVSKVRN